MSKIRVLPDSVANQIAAGEVIERPASVVKELVENALDAGAARVAVEFRAGGSALIRVEDDGHGMERDDALLSLERHATSKIAAAADLDRLRTFGFRGEAVPSIASVSRFRLQTRAAGRDAGTEVLVQGGKIVHVRDCGRAVGTCVEVAQLFDPVPARRKFLKSERTEAAHIVQTVRLYALACPGVAFTLTENGRAVFRSPRCGELGERVAEIFGRQLAAGLAPLEAEAEGMRLRGLVGRPGEGRATRHEMITFVNSRPVDARTLKFALAESYHDALPPGRYPAAFLFFDCDPAAVDVNAHPAKREVRFRREPAVRAFVITSVLRLLRDLAAAARPAFPAAAGGGASPAVFSPSFPGLPLPAAAPPGPPSPLSSPPPSGAALAAAQPSGAGWRYLGSAHGQTAVFETDAGLVLMDRRAAHERVWYERLSEQFRSGPAAAQRLLLPAPIELDPIETALLLDRLAFLRGHGLEIAEFGRNFFRIESVPEWLEPSDAEAFVRDILGALREGGLSDRDPGLAREELARLAAAKAVRLPPPTEAEMLSLVSRLFATRAPLTSPAGRPTLIELSHAEIARRFQR